MFQYEFSSYKNYLRHPAPVKPIPYCFTRLEDIRWIRSSYWAEHCLECGEPLCYETCPNFAPRADRRCKRFRYGISDNLHFKGAPYHAEICFRKWGKLETILYPGSFTPDKAMQIHDGWKQKSARKNLVSHLGKYGLKRYPVEERQKFDSMKYKFSNNEDAKNKQDTFHFLLQLYSYEKEPFTLFFDVTDDADLAFREGITIHPGYNQQCLDVRRLFPPKGKLRAKFYPANNAEADVVFLFCEFVQLKPGVHPRTYPAAQTQEIPAEKVKCIAWDLDCTLWDGILIESDPQTLTLRPGVLDTIRQLDQRGVLQIVVSKNTREDVLPVLERLGIADYFVYILADWGAKSASIKQAAQLLNLGVDAFALIDDSAFERNEIAFSLPMVRTYAETEATGESNTGILSKPELQFPVTEDSRSRRQMYQIEAKRKLAEKDASGDNLEFLRACHLTANLSRPTSREEILRSYELLQRTNQLNLSGRKYELDAFSEHIASCGNDCFILKCEDRFGSYGQTAYLEAHVDRENRILQITEFAMSCRVAGKYVEAALMRCLFNHYHSAGLAGIELLGRKTSRNGLLIRTFLDMGFLDRSGDSDIRLLCPVAESLQNTDVVSVISHL